jgi:hypothetical protein
VERGDRGVGQTDPTGAEHREGFVEREAQLRGAQLRELTREPQAVQAERRLLPRHQHDPQRLRQPREQHLQPSERVLRVEFMQVVDHHLDRLLQPLQLRQEPLYHDGPGEARCRTDPLDHVVAGGDGQGVDHLKAKPLRVVLTALDRDPRDGLFDRRGPRPQQNGLPAPRRCADERDGARRRA